MCPHPDETVLKSLLPRLTARAHRLTGDRARAEDLAQEAVLHLWRQLSDGAEIANPEAYAMVTLRHAAYRTYRTHTRTAPLDENEAYAPTNLPARLALEDVHRAIAALPPDQAALMNLVLEGITSPAELSARMGLPAGTVMSRLARARAKLRRDLGLRPADSVALLW